jgi:spore germination cell wall hydrolase CwlJ-like protein
MIRKLLAVALLLGSAAGFAAPARSASPEDERALALNVYHEGRSGGRDGMLAVGWLTLNRVQDKGFPNAIKDVVYQKRGKGCEFGWTCDKGPDEPAEAKLWEQAQAVAKELLGASPPADPTKGGLWMHESWRKPPSYTKSLVKTASVGKNVYYKRKPAA